MNAAQIPFPRCPATVHIGALALGALAIAEGSYFWTLHTGGSIGHASDVLQPSMVAWNIA